MLKKYTSAEMPEAVYHGESMKSHLSGSELWAYYNDCPAEYVYGEKKESKSMITGSAVHSEVLEMATFDDLYYRGFEPDEDTLTSDNAVKTELRSMGVAGYSNKSGYELWDMLLSKDGSAKIEKNEIKKLEEKNQGKTMLKFDQYDMAKSMRSQLMQYPAYADMVNNGECESSIVGHSSVFGCDVKARPDIIYDGDFIHISNYKTASSAKPEKIIRNSFDNGYFMKEAFNAIVVLEYLGVISSLVEFFGMIDHKNPDVAFEAVNGMRVSLLAQSKKPPYVCSGIFLTNEQIAVGYAQLEKAIGLWSACKESGFVTDYCQGQFITMPTPQYMLNV